MLIDSTPDSDHFVPTDAGSAFLLDGIDSSGTFSGDNIELEQGISGQNSFFTFDIGVSDGGNSIVNEDGGNQYLETAGKGNEDGFERSIISVISRKIHLPSIQASSLTTGLVTIAENIFTGNTETGQIELEFGTATYGVLSLNGVEQINVVGGVNRIDAAGDQFLLEDFSDQNNDVGFTFDQFANYTTDDIVLNGTDGSSTNEDSFLDLEDKTSGIATYVQAGTTDGTAYVLNGITVAAA